MRRVTQTTIAKMHGVSRQTVGYALGLYTNSNIKLSQETKASIIRTAKELGYRPNRLAQIISGRRSGVIGVMNFGGITQMSTQNALNVARVIQAAGYQLMLHDVTWYQEDAMDYTVRSLLDHRVEGLVMISPTDWMPSSALDIIKQSQIPVVSLGGVLFDGIPHVESDYEQETYELVKGLLDADYRSFVLLTNWSSVLHDEAHSGSRLKRMRGFRKAIEERGGSVSDMPQPAQDRTPTGECFFTPMITDWTDPYRNAYMGTHQILARKNLPDVIVCANDDWAAGALKACGEKGIRVPDDMAIAGHDGTVISGYGYVPVTTIIQPLAAMAQKAVEMLLLLMQKKKLSKAEMMVTLPGEIAWRASTRHPQKAAKGKSPSKSGNV